MSKVRPQKVVADDGKLSARQFARKQSGREEGMAFAMSDERYEQMPAESLQASPELFEGVLSKPIQIIYLNGASSSGKTTLANVLWVAVKAPLELLEAREKARDNRILGSARAQSVKVHAGVLYDLECDSGKEPLSASVHKIKQALT